MSLYPCLLYTSGKTPDAKHLEGIDILSECKDCDLISDILDVDLVNISESQCQNDHQRLRARCRAFEGRLKLLESRAESLGDVTARKHIPLIGEKVKKVLARLALSPKTRPARTRPCSRAVVVLTLAR